MPLTDTTLDPAVDRIAVWNADMDRIDQATIYSLINKVLIEGANVTMTRDGSNGHITIASTGVGGGGSGWTNANCPVVLASNGYQTLADGLILQWGANSGGSFSFPIAFPTGCLGFFACNADAQGTYVDNAYGYAISPTQFSIFTKASPTPNAVTTYPTVWFAIGH